MLMNNKKMNRKEALMKLEDGGDFMSTLYSVCKTYKFI